MATKKISIILSCIVATAVTVSLFVVGPVKSNVEANSKVPYPQLSAVKEKKHFTDMKKLKLKAKDSEEADQSIQQYLLNLSESDLLLTIAETADELEKLGSESEMGIFANSVEEKLIDKISQSDFLEMAKDKNLSNTFRIFMLDAASYADTRKLKKNSQKLNTDLRSLVKTLDDDRLSTYILSTIDDYSTSDVELLKSLIIKDNSSPQLKSMCLEKITHIDKKEALAIAKNIIANSKRYSVPEIKSSLYTLSEIARKNRSSYDSDEVQTLINYSKLHFRNGNEKTLDDTIIFSLGECKNVEALKVLLDNRNIINDDKFLEYIADQNYTEINTMLNKVSNTEELNIALAFVEIAPFQEYCPILEKLKNENLDNDTFSKIETLIEKTRSSTFVHNSKWDKF